MKKLLTLLLLSTLVAACGDDIKGESGQDATALALYAFNRPNYEYNPENNTQVLVRASEEDPAIFAIGDPRQAGDSDQFAVLEATETLIMDLDEEGPGGLDALPKEADTIYYLYAINDNGAPKLLGSKNPPTDGPTNIEAGKWTYLGAFMTDSNANVFYFRRTGHYLRFGGMLGTNFQLGPQVTSAFTSGTSTQLTPIKPSTVQQIEIASIIEQNGGGAGLGEVYYFLDDGTTVYYFHSASSSATSNKGFVEEFWIPLIDNDFHVLWVSRPTSWQLRINVTGWIEDPTHWL